MTKHLIKPKEIYNCKLFFSLTRTMAIAELVVPQRQDFGLYEVC